MCASCPELEKRLHGATLPQIEGAIMTGRDAGLCCGSCGMTFEAVRKGENLGCSECYEIFGDILLQEFAKETAGIGGGERKKVSFVHVGRSPGEVAEIDPSSRLSALNEALQESLKHEDYEQAALLRDQIKDLTEGKSEKEES